MREKTPATLQPSPAFLDLKALKQRGWTARLVRIFLGEPDDTERLSAAHTGRPKNLYCAKRVALVELHDPQFRAEREKAAMYSGRLKQTQDAKKKNLVGIVEAMDLPDFDLPFEELLDQANKKLEGDKNLAGTTSERVALGILLDSSSVDSGALGFPEDMMAVSMHGKLLILKEVLKKITKMCYGFFKIE